MKSETIITMFQCSYCSKDFKYESEKKRHEQSHTPQFECKVCSKKFSFISALRRHEKQHIRTGSVKCDICSGNFRDETLLRRHIQYAHKEAVDKVPRDSFATNANATIVEVVESSLFLGITVDKFCNWRAHVETVCKKLAKHIYVLNRLRQIVSHEAALAAYHGTYTCTKCSSKFSSDQALRTHTKIHKPQAERRFHCTFVGCTKSFNFAHHMKHHESTHGDEKQHYCKVCGKGFIQSHHLKIHMKNHEPDSWLTCEVTGCNKKFSNGYAMKRHLATHRKKPDSGISSDSCDTSSAFIAEEMVLCPSCNQVISQEYYKKHISRCVKPEKSVEFSVTSLELSIKEISDEIDQKSPNILPYDNLFINKDNSVDSMATVHKSKDQCDQIAEVANEFDEAQHKRNVQVVKLNEPLITEFIDDKVINTTGANICENCRCTDTCIKMDNVAFEYGNDGIVKIKDTFDIDIVKDAKTNIGDLKSEISENDYNLDNAVSFNSCKDVLGNCIVSGNGTMGEECLCAKMVAENGQIIAQEIEEITPCPKNTWLSQRLL